MNDKDAKTKSLETPECTTPRREHASIFFNSKKRNENQKGVSSSFESIHSHSFVCLKLIPFIIFFDVKNHADWIATMSGTRFLGWCSTLLSTFQRLSNYLIGLWLHCLVQQRFMDGKKTTRRNNLCRSR